MTKLEEMKRYDAFVASLPEDSYLRPWLTDIRESIETDLRCDVIPYRSMKSAREEAKIHEAYTLDNIARREAASRRHAQAIIDAAKATADATAKAAERAAEWTRQELRDDLARLRSAINSVA